MGDSPLSVWRERDGRLLRLRLARPKANVIDAAMVRALRAAAEEHLGAGDLGGVLIDAEGPHFSFGASVEEHLPEQCRAMIEGFHGLLGVLWASPVPCLVAIRGQCLGGGLELACSGHVLFASPEARLGQPEIKLGVIAPAASCLLPERIGAGRAADLLLSGRSVGGAEALAMGLVNALAEDPEAAALEYFDEHLGPGSASSLGFAIRAARAGTTDRLKAKLAEVERLYLEELMATHDAVEGLEAFLEKRPPAWKHA